MVFFLNFSRGTDVLTTKFLKIETFCVLRAITITALCKYIIIMRVLPKILYEHVFDYVNETDRRGTADMLYNIIINKYAMDRYTD